MLIPYSAGVQLWQYAASHAAWRQISMYSTETAVRCVAWAQSCGRPEEVIAAGCDSMLLLLGLKGPTDNLQVCLGRLLVYGLFWHSM